MKNSSANVTRRQFLHRTAAAAAAGVAAPYIIPSQVLAAEGRPGANDRIGIAGIGIGRQGSGVLRGALKFKETRFVAIADVNLPRAKQFAAKSDAVAYQDYRKLLERKDVDAIITATPDHWRALVCIHACQAGKDVYAEKALSLTIREGRLMVEAARRYKRVFQVGSQQRSIPINRIACAFIRNGGLGKISEVNANNFPSPWECALPAQPVPDGLDWDMWCGPAPLMPFHKDLYAPRANPGWLSFRPYSGGEMTGWGAHGLDQVQWALGMDGSGPVEVWTEGPKFNPPTYTEPESRARGDKLCSVPKVLFRYANGTLLRLDKGNGGGGIFLGEKGKMEIFRGRVTSNPPGLAEELTKQAGANRENHVQNWIQCLKSREKPVADVEIGHRSITVAHLGNIARWLGRRLRWDPVKECFPDDTEANQYLDRARRKPYELPKEV